MAKVYVSTYKKYNEGNLDGAWLDLAKYETYQDFMKACRELHKDECDPEYMIQDAEGFPDGLSCMESLSEDDFNDVKLAMKEEQQEAEGKPAINIIDYSEKAFAVVGDTRAVKDSLKKMGGRFNNKLSCGAGWIFSNKSREAVEQFIQSGEVIDAANADRKKQVSGGEQFVNWLEEYIEKSGRKECKKYYVGAIKMHDRFYLLDKPSIDTRFCFHDEGPQYEFYKTLKADESKMARYFINENLSQFRNHIGHIENGDKFTEDKRVWWYFCDYDKNKLYLQFYCDSWSCDCEKGTLCTDEEKQLILKGLKFAKGCFEKRLDQYLKRYGTSKLHTWTYWADA